MNLTRRAALLGLGAAWSLGRTSIAFGAPAPLVDQRLVVILLRGALDGLAAVSPYGDARLASLRAPLLLPEPGQPGGLLELGGFFGLHPALGGLHELYRGGELLAVHATAGGYRSRSHFEAQDYLESGTDHRLSSGWLNRVVGALPAPSSDAAADAPDGRGLSVGLSLPLLLRGPAPISGYAPPDPTHPSPDLYARIASLAASDPLTGPAIAQALRARAFAAATPGLPGETPARRGGQQAALAFAAGRLLAAADGPRIAALELGGWDTHAAQQARLAGPLAQLDRTVLALRSGLGEAWRRSVVLVMTEFGRTVRINGTGGTDHGTAGVAFLAGGAVQGGRVAGTWPGLASSQLYEDRDLAPTTDLRSLAKGVLADHLRLPAASLATVFPDSAQAGPARGLVRV